MLLLGGVATTPRELESAVTSLLSPGDTLVNTSCTPQLGTESSPKQAIAASAPRQRPADEFKDARDARGSPVYPIRAEALGLALPSESKPGLSDATALTALRQRAGEKALESTLLVLAVRLPRLQGGN